MEQSSKFCGTCQTTKPISEFSHNASKRDGYSSNCKECWKVRKASRRLVDPKLDWAKTAFFNARLRVRANHHCPFTITVEDVLALTVDVCPVFGLTLRYPGPKDVFTAHRAYPNSPSLDRIIPELGYVPGNIIVISHHANMIKSYGTAAEHRRLADWLDAMATPNCTQE